MLGFVLCVGYEFESIAGPIFLRYGNPNTASTKKEIVLLLRCDLRCSDSCDSSSRKWGLTDITILTHSTHSKHVSSFNASSLCTRRWVYIYIKVSFNHVNIILTILIILWDKSIQTNLVFVSDSSSMISFFFFLVMWVLLIISCCFTTTVSFLRLDVLRNWYQSRFWISDFRLPSMKVFISLIQSIR